MTFEQWWANFRENIDPACETGAKLIAMNAWGGATVAERERCAAVVRLADPVTTYYNDTAGEERECVDWGRTAEMLERRILTPPTESARSNTCNC